MDLTEIPADGSFLRHPWEAVRAAFFSEILRPIVSGAPAAMLDAGAGDGWFATQLASEHPFLTITCFDPGYGNDGGQPAQTDRVSYVASQPRGPFDVLTLLDVLEHIEDDAAALDQLVAVVRPGGHVLVSVPAWPALFSRHDVALKHFRRYTPRQMLALLDRAGLLVLKSGGLFHSLLLARGVSLVGERLRPGSAAGNGPAEHALQWRAGPHSRRFVQAVLSGDARLSLLMAERQLQIPGLSCWALCRRPS